MPNAHTPLTIIAPKTPVKGGKQNWNTRVFPTWCPGCGDWGIWAALKQALTNLGKKPEEVVIVYGVGCSGNMTSFVNTYAFHGLHGRALPVAEGIKLANDKLTVIVVAGDGDGYGIGVGHFIHAMRRNFDLTYIVHNNAVYGLTTGQTSPTALKGFKSKSTPEGVIEEPINPLALAITTGATFVSRSQAADIPHLAQTIEAGIKHNGFSLVDVFQHCATFNKVNTVQWYREHIYKVEKPYGPKEKAKALEKTLESGRYPVGVLYHEEHPAYDDEVSELDKGPLVERDISNVDITPLFEEFR